ncbi:MAG: Vegetative catalase [Deltaproteobacteria bacterium ADurb.Bin510]|nr:MAG: Vegetative catalase [Deltaproteobacteria bacterium ADurb.Bin510]
MSTDKRLTTSFGIPVSDDQNSRSAGEHGPLLLENVHLLDKLGHFNRERIPERVVHAKGAGAWGFFELTHDVTQFTKARFLSEVGKRTEVFVRFSTVGGEKGSADTARDPRGFAVRFFTEEGNCDLVGNNTPVFFIRDPLKFPDFIHSQKRNPATNCPDPDAFWDFLSLTPESIHQVTILFSDRGTPDGYRHMHGFGSHTFMCYNAAGKYHWIKIHIKTNQGIKNLTRQQACELAGSDPDYATRDLHAAIERGDYPSWTLMVQRMTPEQARDYRFDIFDVTRIWPHADFPLIELGTITLNRNPTNFFNEVEQVAFSPANLVPGLAPSPDKMLQARLFAYHDAQLHRLGPNHHLIPVNRPRGFYEANYQRDGSMRTDEIASGPNYWPNSFGGPQPQAFDDAPAIELAGVTGRYRHASDDDYLQAGNLYRHLMKHNERDNLIDNIAAHLGQAQRRIQLRQCALFFKADPDYGNRVARALNLDAGEVVRLAAMSDEDRAAATAR